jgi:hypothetical protein
MGRWVHLFWRLWWRSTFYRAPPAATRQCEVCCSAAYFLMIFANICGKAFSSVYDCQSQVRLNLWCEQNLLVFEAYTYGTMVWDSIHCGIHWRGLSKGNKVVSIWELLQCLNCFHAFCYFLCWIKFRLPSARWILCSAASETHLEEHSCFVWLSQEWGTAAINPRLHIPSPNLFIATDFSIRDWDPKVIDIITLLDFTSHLDDTVYQYGCNVI